MGHCPALSEPLPSQCIGHTYVEVYAIPVFFESSFDELHAARPISVKERITVLNIVDFIV